jgi:hypothetical protein
MRAPVVPSRYRGFRPNDTHQRRFRGGMTGIRDSSQR